MQTELSKEKSAAEREHDLWIASERYMRGEISVEELEEVEHPRAMDLKEAILSLARQNVEQRFALASKTERVVNTH